jgi:parallel beta-helix repeat protein
MGSRPLISANDIRDNETGILCNQMSDPEIRANTIAGNRRGVYLHLSSYARIHGNNLEDNGVQLELGNMSVDWERRAGQKPMRGRLRQNQGRAEKGIESGGATKDGSEMLSGVVDAAGNWWGDATTREMEQKGPAADISSLVDYYDVPTRTYEGYEGEYVQDRIVYAPWEKERISEAGVPPRGSRPEETPPAAPSSPGSGRP